MLESADERGGERDGGRKKKWGRGKGVQQKQDTIDKHMKNTH